MLFILGNILYKNLEVCLSGIEGMQFEYQSGVNEVVENVSDLV